ncbi:MAG: hypothetical protein ACJA2Q_001022 [Pseudohongiellaceae bacterium]|jgi:hypothetical protein
MFKAIFADVFSIARGASFGLSILLCRGEINNLKQSDNRSCQRALDTYNTPSLSHWLQAKSSLKIRIK